MCKLIAELAGADKQVLREMIHRLEMASGAPGVDVRLTGEIYGKLHMKMRELGLDPNDTTPHELYGALQSLAILHDKFLAAKIGIANHKDTREVLPAAVKLANNTNMPKKTWALKHSAIKRLLKATPPKSLMKLLNYRSVDSLLKRESMGMVMTVARHTEPILWQQRLTKAYKKLQPNDFETKNIEITYLLQTRWDVVGQAFVAQSRTPVLHCVETGTIAVLPMPSHTMEGLTITSLLLIFHYINEIRAYGTYFKFHHLRGDFGQFLVGAISGENHDHARIGAQPVHWRVVHRYYGTTDRINHPEIFEPHVQPEDLYYRKAETLLYQIEPALHFWNDLDFVGLPQPDGPLSFNLADMSLNVLNRVPYERRVNYHLKEAVWNELYCRYMGKRNLEQQLLQRLDDKITENTFVQEMEFAW